MAGSPVDVIEAAYELELDARAWLRRLATTLQPQLEDGYGILAYYFDVRTSPARWLESKVVLGMSLRDQEAMRGLAQEAPKLLTAIHSLPVPFVVGLDAVWQVGLDDTRDHARVRAMLSAIGARDAIALRTIEPEGKGVAIAAPVSREYKVALRAQRTWARVAAHLAAARRMREALLAAPPRDEAVLTPSGRVEHAEGRARTTTARDALRTAVMRQETARGRLRREDPHAATEMWTALVAGRWTIVDRFERDGRRYLVAHPNEHALEDPRALTPRERAVVQLAVLGKSNKLIAYELGIALSTVSTHLSMAMRKLGFASRADLTRLGTQLRVGGRAGAGRRVKER